MTAFIFRIPLETSIFYVVYFSYNSAFSFLYFQSLKIIGINYISAIWLTIEMFKEIAFI